MPECRDCAHWKVCNEYRRAFWGHKAQHSSPIVNASADSCIFYKDRSRFVELPCKVGDTVYVIVSIAGEEKIIQDHVETIGIGYYADGINIYQFDGVKTDGYFEDFGKTVFLTREAAEQALKEREGNA